MIVLINRWRTRRRRRCSRRRHTPWILLLCERIVAAHQHAAHHVEHRVALRGYLDAEVHLAHLRQSVVPLYLFQMSQVVSFELFEEVGRAALDSEEKKAEEVEEW